MNDRFPLRFAVLLAVGACGGDAPSSDADAPTPAAESSTPAPAASAFVQPTGPLETPEWFTVDHSARTVAMTITAGATPVANYWNFNGYVTGEMVIEVPEGYAVTIEFVNEDPTMPHSLGVSSELVNFMAPIAPDPVFAGAITADPTSMTSSTLPGESETITFTASEAGDYSLVCYIAGHTAVGMWVFFTVTEDGSAGIRS